MKRILFVLITLAGVLVFSVNHVQAGGWAVVSLVELPRSIEVDEVVELQFRVLQHGINPLADLESYIEARHLDSEEELIFQGEYDSIAGVYNLVITFPQEGEWEWKIVAFGEHPMPLLNISADPQVGTNGSGAVVWWRVWLEEIFGRSQDPQKELPVTQMYATEEDYGAALFVAKGCVTCHLHADVPNSGAYVSNSTPELSDYVASETYLQSWLSDPQAIKPNTDMPNLELSEKEIQALIIFLNGD